MNGQGLDALIPNKGSGQYGADGPAPAIVPERELPDDSEALLDEPMPLEHLSAGVAPHEEPLPAARPTPPPPQQPPAAAPVQAAPSRPVSPVAEKIKSIAPNAPRQAEAIFHIEVDKIQPNPQQPRRHFDEAALKDLAASMREFGILQPIVVTKIEREVPTGTVVEYQLIAGERRLMAAKMLGMERIPAIIKRVDVARERLEMAIIENLQRENLNPIEMARAYARLQDEFRMTQREIAAQLGKSREVVANAVRLLDLPQDIQRAVEEGAITESHGRLLLAIEEPAARQQIFSDLLQKHMTTRELKGRVEALRVAHPSTSKHHAGAEALSPELRSLQDRLSSELGTPVKISQSGETGKITISFYSREELDQIIQRLGAEEDL